MLRFAVACLLALLPACATVQSGAFEIPAGYAETAFAKLKGRASFDLDCPADQLTVVTLDVYASPGGNYPSEVGVQGCGRKAVYVPKDQVWLANGGVSRSFDQAPKAAAAAAPSGAPSAAPAP
jgi:hypothetical protein